MNPWVCQQVVLVSGSSLTMWVEAEQNGPPLQMVLHVKYVLEQSEGKYWFEGRIVGCTPKKSHNVPHRLEIGRFMSI